MDGPDVLLLDGLGEADRIRAAFDEHLLDVDLRVAEDPDGDDALATLGDTEVVLTFRFSDEHLAAAEELRWVQALNAGVDSYPLDRLAERDIPLTNSSGIHAEQMGQQVLVDALDSGEIRGAALDVTDPEPLPEASPLRDRYDVVLTPHMAGSSPYYFDRAVELFAENYEAFVAGEDLRNRIV